ncbi:glycosyltransferase family A protein [Rhodococcus sovatensis]|uniref:4,4'-diaponeurosporenoate glycosyltransferase n=1 Tax=Rhodococcus sovatensis TaxID=1805840 RepID=A0ABZ2PLJ9_9NOCA
MPDLWVIVPAYNEEVGIFDTLASLAVQQDPSFTLLVVDNGSTDGTRAVVTEFARENPRMRTEIVSEPVKGTGAAADTGMRYAIAAGAELLARTDADCLPAPDWTVQIRRGFDSGLLLLSGDLRPRTDEGVGRGRVLMVRAAVELASFVGKYRSGNRDPSYLGPYVMTPGCNMAITAELYVEAGGFPRTCIEDLHEDRALVNAVRRVTRRYGRCRAMRVYGSQRRVKAWGIVKTLQWYADHRFRPELVDIR